MQNKKQHKLLLVCLAVLVCMVWLVGAILQKAEKDTAQQSRDAVMHAIVQCAVQCYVVEGAYPTDLEHLEKNYGLLVDRKRYIITYEAFASNVMPDIQILIRE